MCGCDRVELTDRRHILSGSAPSYRPKTPVKVSGTINSPNTREKSLLMVCAWMGRLGGCGRIAEATAKGIRSCHEIFRALLFCIERGAKGDTTDEI